MGLARNRVVRNPVVSPSGSTVERAVLVVLLLGMLVIPCQAASVIRANVGNVSRFVGSTAVGSDDGAGDRAQFDRTFSALYTPAGDVLVADRGNSALRRVAAGTDVVTTFRSGIDRPVQIALSPNGTTLYVLQQFMNRLVTFPLASPTAPLVEIAGGFDNPVDLAMNNNTGDVYIANFDAGTIVRVEAASLKNTSAAVPSCNGVAVKNSDGTVFAASRTRYTLYQMNRSLDGVAQIVGTGAMGYEDNIGLRAKLRAPRYMHMTPDERWLFFVDGYRIRRVDLTTGSYIVSTLFNQAAAYTLTVSSLSYEATATSPSGVAFNAAGDMMLVVFHNGLLKVAYNASLAPVEWPVTVSATTSQSRTVYPRQTLIDIGATSVWVGSATAGYRVGAGAAAGFMSPPQGCAVANNGYTFVAAFTASRIRKIAPGNAFVDDHVDFGLRVHGITVDSAGTYLYATVYQDAPSVRAIGVRRIAVDQTSDQTRPMIGTLPGFGMQLDMRHSSSHLFIAAQTTGVVRMSVVLLGAPETLTLSPISAPQWGPSASLVQAIGLAVKQDDPDRIFVGTGRNNRIVQVSNTGVATVVAGNGESRSDDGFGTDSSFDMTGYLAIDRNNRFLYIVENQGNRIRQMSLETAEVSTVVNRHGARFDLRGASASYDAFAPAFVGLCFNTNGSFLVATVAYGAMKIDYQTPRTPTTALTVTPPATRSASHSRTWPTVTTSASAVATRSETWSGSASRATLSVSHTSTRTLTATLTMSLSATVTRTSSEVQTLSSDASATQSLTQIPPGTRSRTLSLLVTPTTSLTSVRSTSGSATVTGLRTRSRLQLSATGTRREATMTRTPSLPAYSSTQTLARQASSTPVPSTTLAPPRPSTTATTTMPFVVATPTTSLSASPAVTTSVQPPPPPRPKPAKPVMAEALPPTQTAVEVATSTAGLTGVNPALATQVTVLSSLRKLDLCATDPEAAEDDSALSEQPPIAEHPLRFGIAAAGEAQQYHGGQVIGNVVVFFIFVALSLGIAAPLRLSWGRRSAFAATTGGNLLSAVPGLAAGRGHVIEYTDAVAWARFPGILAFPLVFLLPPIASASSLLLSTSGTTAVGILLGIFGLIVSLAAIALSAGVFARGFSQNIVWSQAQSGSDDTSSDHLRDTAAAATPLLLDDGHAGSGAPAAVRATLRGAEKIAKYIDSDGQWLALDGSWVSRRGGGAFDGTGHMMRSLGMFFEAYRESAPWYLVLELAVACAVSVATGFIPAIGCRGAAWLLLVLYLAYFVSLMYWRPHACRADRVIYPLLLGAQTLVSLLAVATIEVSLSSDRREGSDVPDEVRGLQETTNGLLCAAATFGGGLAIYELVKVVYLQVLTKARERERKKLEYALERAANAGTHAGLLAVPEAPDAAEVPPPNDVHDSSYQSGELTVPVAVVRIDDVDADAFETVSAEAKQHQVASSQPKPPAAAPLPRPQRQVTAQQTRHAAAHDARDDDFARRAAAHVDALMLGSDSHENRFEEARLLVNISLDAARQTSSTLAGGAADLSTAAAVVEDDHDDDGLADLLPPPSFDDDDGFGNMVVAPNAAAATAALLDELLDPDGGDDIHQDVMDLL